MAGMSEIKEPNVLVPDLNLISINISLPGMATYPSNASERSFSFNSFCLKVYLLLSRSMYKIDLNTIIGINSNEQLSASDYKLEQNFPNPFNPETTIKYSVSRKSFVQIKVYDISGRLINSLVAKELSAGSYSAVWNGKDITGNNVSSGIYFYNMTINGGKSVSRKMLLIK